MNEPNIREWHPGRGAVPFMNLAATLVLALVLLVLPAAIHLSGCIGEWCRSAMRS